MLKNRFTVDPLSNIIPLFICLSSLALSWDISWLPDLLFPFMMFEILSLLHSMMKLCLYYCSFSFHFYFPFRYHSPGSQCSYFSLGGFSPSWYLVWSFLWSPFNNYLIFHSSNIFLHLFVKMMYQWLLKSYDLFSLWVFVWFFGFHFDDCECSFLNSCSYHGNAFSWYM